jgi:hypothetical protein
MTASPIRSQAQRAMLTRVVADEEYAKARGIGAAAAQAMLDAHEAAGSPMLPDRSAPSVASPPRRPGKPRRYALLGAH